MGGVCRGLAFPRPAHRSSGVPTRGSARVRSVPAQCGRGAVLYPDLLSHEHLARRGGGADGPVLDVDAGVLLAVVESRLAAGDDLPVEPLYLRRPDALTLAERGVR